MLSSSIWRRQALHVEQSWAGDKNSYARFFPAFTLAHLFRCAAAIFRRADADIVRFAAAELVVFPFRFPRRSFCARLIRLRADADIPRLGSV